MSTLPFLSPVAAYSGKVRGGTERVMGVQPGRNNRGGYGEFFDGRSTEGVVVGCVGTVEKGRHGEKEGGGVGGRMGVVSRTNNVTAMIDGSNSNSCLSSIGYGDEGLGGGDNTSTNNRKRCLVVEVPKETEVGENWEGGEGTRNERAMGAGVEMNEEHRRCLSSLSLDSNPCIMSPHQDVHMAAATAFQSGGNFVVGNNNTPLCMTNNNNYYRYHDLHHQDAAYYCTDMESGGMIPNRVKSPGGTLRNYSVEEAMGIKRGKTRGDPSIKKYNFITKCDDERTANVKGIVSSSLENVPSDTEKTENDRTRKLDLKKKLDAAVVLRSLKNMTPAACNEMLQSNSSNKDFTMCMVSESKLRETVKSRLERLEVDGSNTKNEEAINLDGGGETSLSSASSQQSQDLKLTKYARPNTPSKQKLKAWLEEHHHNPYPMTRTKVWLSEITGMTVKQVSTWFMNARARMGLVQKMKREQPHGRDVAINKADEAYSNVYPNDRPNDRPAGLQYYLPTVDVCNNPFVEKGGGGDRREEGEQCGAGPSTEALDTSSNGTESSLNGDTVMNHQDIDAKGEEREGRKVHEIPKREGSSYDEELVEDDIEEGIVDDQRRLEGQNNAEDFVFFPGHRATSSQGSIDTELDFGIEMPEGDTSRPSKRRRINPWERATLERWLYAHLDNPYPTLSEKVELAKRTKMSIKQVNAWFMNTRARRGLMRLFCEKS
eukprot:195781_1